MFTNDGKTTYLPRLSWETSLTEAGDLQMKPYFDQIWEKVFAVEEEVLTTQVVALLRSRGYTVIEPEIVVVREQIQAYYS